MSEYYAKKNREGVLICGAYGMGNAGDEAILEAIIKEMRSIDPGMPITVLTRQPEATSRRYGVRAIYTLNAPAFLSVMRRVKLYINGGGSLIQDVTSSRSLWYYLFTIAAARRLGCLVLMYGCGIGPVGREFNRRLVRRVLNRNVEKITLRELSSAEELERFGVTEPEVIPASDPAVSLEAAPDDVVDEAMSSFGMPADGKYICFCLRTWQGFAERAEHFGRAADYAYEKHGLVPVFISIDHRSDAKAAGKAIAHMSAPHFVLRDPMPTAVTSGVIRRMKAMVSMRLHGLIFGAVQSVPLAGVSYDPKVTAFLRHIGQENFVELEDVTAGVLCDMIDRALASEPRALTEATARIREMENRNTRAARSLYELTKEE